jgi:hypothetical protein
MYVRFGGLSQKKVGDRLRGRRKEVGERLEIEVWGNKDKIKGQRTKKCSKVFIRVYR